MTQNLTKIKDNTYFLRSQAGFRKAIKEFHEDKSECDRKLVNFPTTYPCLVVLTSVYMGGCYATTCHILDSRDLSNIEKMNSRSSVLKETK